MQLSPASTIERLLNHPAMKLTSMSALSVYLRLVQLREVRGNPLKATNAELHLVGRTALRALHELEGANLVKVNRDGVDGSRTILVK